MQLRVPVPTPVGLVACVVVTAIVAPGSTSPAPVAPEPNCIEPPPSRPRIPPTPECEGWPHELAMRAAMQDCSLSVELETNERWYPRVRAEVVNHRVVGVTFVELGHDCHACFADRAPGREQRARDGERAITACIREHLQKAVFDDPHTCTFDTRWQITADW